MVSQVFTSTVAALVGSAIGASAPVLSNYVLQVGTTRRELLTRQIAVREALYSEFIQSAATLYADSLTNNLEDVEKLVALYSLVARIRLMSSEPVVLASEQLVREIVGHYAEPNMTIQQMQADVMSAKTDPLGSFSKACRREILKVFKSGVVDSRNL